ncbi:transglycosylase family protein [Mycobacterium sp. M1]|uniref:Transglycosylase family protein n=1 Tax=Mycolicibacter acidiphilus TaxID=2835306 RepID=A0ABS5RM15_9MYCO|nr:transglycosylase family protein [Mycolicibacter acidiphilus]MBS9534531.1 transglycosylase family protein [Mycolicibacter acidiphilus]
MRNLTVLTTAVLVFGVADLAGAASADPINWQAIAKCESGGNWAADTGNGDYGGLQISEATWAANGGVGLPSQASEQQQIAVAQQIMSKQGPGAWPSCASRGADGGGGPAGAVTGAPVGSLTHYLNLLIEDAEGAGTQAY